MSFSESNVATGAPKRHLVVDVATGDEIDVSSLPTTDAERKMAAGQATNTEVTPIAKPGPIRYSGIKQWYYCMGQYHGVPLGDEGRLFEAPIEGCPTCPNCKDERNRPVQVNAIPTVEGVIPDIFTPRLQPGYGG